MCPEVQRSTEWKKGIRFDLFIKNLINNMVDSKSKPKMMQCKMDKVYALASYSSTKYHSHHSRSY